MIPSPASDAAALIERALGLVMADGEAAAHLAGLALAEGTADAEQRVQAQCILALVELREGGLAAGLTQLEAARAAHDPVRDGARTGWLLEHVQTQRLRRAGRLSEAQAGLRLLHAQVERRPAVDAYLSAGSLGVVLSMQGDNDGALDMFYQALAIARRSGVESLVVNALNNLGSFQSDLYDLEDACPLLEECLAGARRVGSRRQTIYAAGNLVQCLCLMGRPEEALAVAREHLMGQIRADDLPALHRDEEIAQALLDNGRVDEAQAVLGGEVHIDPMSNELATARVWLGARILLARGSAREALQLCLARQAMLRQQGEESTVAIDRVNLLRVAAQASGGVGDHALAYRLLHEAFVTHEALLGRAARSRQISLQISHRLQQAEWERDTAQQLAARLEALNLSLQVQVAENDRLQARLRAQALEDPLTGLHNRRHLFEAGGALLALLRRRAVPLAAALVDLDHFKQVNDQHGHDAGDRALRAFADLARGDTRAEDLVCRHGGEEFVMLFPGADAAQAAARLRDLLQRFRALPLRGNGSAVFSCSFSAGVAGWRGGDEDLAALLSRADAALYVAKQSGRAQVRLDSMQDDR